MNKKDFCCKELVNSIIDQNIIDYDNVIRSYVIAYNKGRCSALEFCPFCGTKLPEWLNSKIFDVIEEEYGIPFEKIDIVNFKNMPDEFRTDEWWKKRGL